MTEIDSVTVRPDTFGWKISLYVKDDGIYEFSIGDAIQFHNEVERTIGRWLADGPADFHTADSTEPIYVREETDWNETNVLTISGEEMAANLKASVERARDEGLIPPAKEPEFWKPNADGSLPPQAYNPKEENDHGR